MGDFSAREQRSLDRRRAVPLPRPSRIIAGFLLAGLIGLTAYFLPLFQSASTPIVTSGGGLINPVVRSDRALHGPAARIRRRLQVRGRSVQHAVDDPGPRRPRQQAGDDDVDPARPVGSGRRAARTWGRSTPPIRRAACRRPSPPSRQNFHVRIDDYVWIGLTGLIKVIDTLGGVNLVVTNPVMDDFYPADINTSTALRLLPRRAAARTGSPRRRARAAVRAVDATGICAATSRGRSDSSSCSWR